MLQIVAGVAVVTVGLVGCSSKNKGPSKPPIAEINNTINDGTFGATDKLDCADGKSLNIGGSKNTLTVTGRCGSVVIGGDENKLRFQRVDAEIVIAGLNNTVTYREGNPQIQDLGLGNSITKG
ncbi:hypothetical protein B1987_08030 [Mycobacterium kansasii]|uniref:DUF3060 domain-containing protein n=1 Tax=Mycobacterium attenuatum TaxID=2341086 RepID=A0A498Q8G9_9MYCO|nr:DUF3060 domain-containing protein [Mycobacterium attenuatum]ORB83762.1 hypothetical protein B1987_08030 [Mycobacterium kansasii]VBA41886.1 hypothetical protein LAUMK136_04289 [Mycobacterium attenuatum]VBA57967.1 hypothetical protein LAUMK191_04290 [Mycobacterium attenuatum]VBA61036.1 hypothetical protein LAUMK41_04407 [Mycobacterium attenuatum]